MSKNISKMGQISKTKRIKNEMRTFATNMSAHGVPRLATADHFCAKIMWTAVLLCCVACFAFHANQIVSKFMRYEKIINIAIRVGESVAFPSVTICNINPYKFTEAMKVDELKRTLTTVEKTLKELKNKIEPEKGDTVRAKRSLSAREAVNHLPGLTVCVCPEPENTCFAKRHIEPTNDTQMCVCFYDQSNDNLWPCYAKNLWKLDYCSNCNILQGTCPYPDSAYGKAEPSQLCLCQGVSHYCIIAIDKTGGVNKNASLDIDDYLFNMWEARTTTVSPAFEVQEETVVSRITNLSDSTSISTIGRDDMSYAVATLDKNLRINISYRSEDIIKLCSFNGKECHPHKNFTLHLDPTYGNCFTFNRFGNISSSRSGPNYGLKVTAHLSPADYLQVTESAGLRVVIHDKDEYPFPDSYGYNAAPGQLTSFGLQMQHLTRLQPPYGECLTREQGDLGNYNYYENYAYSFEGCYRSCVQQYIVRQCGCGDPRYPVRFGDTHCPLVNSSKKYCVDSAFYNMSILNEGTNCTCPQPCKQTVYSISMSSARWPLTVFQLPKDCALPNDGCLYEYRQNGAMIELFYERTSYEVLVESQAYGTANLMADFGGQLGLWLGVSVITITEIIVLLWNILVICCEDPPFFRDADPVPTEEPNDNSISQKWYR